MENEEYYDYLKGWHNSKEYNKILQERGEKRLEKSKKLLDKEGIEFTEGTQMLKFEYQGIVYTYWTKLNRVYKHNTNLGVTLIQFLKSGKVKVNKSYEEFIISIGKYRDRLLKTMTRPEEIDYCKWFISTCVNERDKHLIHMKYHILKISDSLKS